MGGGDNEDAIGVALDGFVNVGNVDLQRSRQCMRVRVWI